MVMSKTIQIAQRYFDLSNTGNIDEIAQLFTDSSTYSSQNTGVFLGKEQIIKMQRVFHNSHKNLNWKINSVNETSPGIVLFDFDLTGVKPSGEKFCVSGLEYVIVYNEKIQHVEIRNK